MQSDSPSKPTYLAESAKLFAVSQLDSHIKIYSKEKLAVFSNILTNHSAKISSICLKQAESMLVSGGCDGLIQLWDTRSLMKPVHQFSSKQNSYLGPGKKFNCLDVSDKILAAANGKRIAFFDLRKMKQKCEFTETFNDQISYLQFDSDSNLKTCCYDGFINEFDLTQTGEEESLVWGYKIIESPIKLQFKGQTGIVQTCQHMIFTFEEHNLKEKFSMSTIDSPQHILYSKLAEDYRAEYYCYDVKESYITKYLNSQVAGYACGLPRVELILPLGQYIAHISETGQLDCTLITNQLIDIEATGANHRDFEMYIDGPPRVSRDNGIVLEKCSILKDKTKKFRPY